MPNRTLPWFDSLTDSVYALGEAAREYRHAYRAACLARESVDVDRRQLHEGRIDLAPHAKAVVTERFPFTRAPQEYAVFKLGRLYLDTEHATQEMYEEAALMYAAGAAWAIRRVQAGEQPPLVVFQRDSDGTFATRSYMSVLYGGLPSFERYRDAGRLQAAYSRLAERLAAADVAEDLAGEEFLADHEASAMHEALDITQDTGDVAYALGELLEGAVRFSLIGAKQEHERARVAETRAAAAEQQAER
ncbi:hypothetical protein AB0J25_12020 [Streptomyces sp. NPDC049910]|uniref:hypothetical protein n=1 Tax=Streptomyces sp. NPDC049910 TaxID=3155278 RepID=UPI003413CFB9